MGKGKEKGRGPNDQRSNALNPNNPSYNDSQDNRATQLNPNSSEYKSSKRGKEKK